LHAAVLLGTASALRQSHYVHWNTTNPIFRIDNTDHIIDVNRGNKPWEYDQVQGCQIFLCSTYQNG
jgi:ephrin-B